MHYWLSLTGSADACYVNIDTACDGAVDLFPFAQVEVLSQLTALRRLDLGSNQVTSISCLSALTALSQLSVESNHLCSLQGVEGMSALMELYAANNTLEEIKVRMLQGVISCANFGCPV